MMDSLRRVIFNAIGSERRHYCQVIVIVLFGT
jgi:hypothetical protein